MPPDKRSGPQVTTPKGRPHHLIPQRIDFTVPRVDDLRPTALRGWAAACAHLRDHGLEPLPPRYVVRALRRRGWW